MPIRSGRATWRGDLKSGHGRVDVESGTFDAEYSFPSRFETGEGTNPEELLGAAHAACFAMALSNLMAGEGHPPDRVSAEARVHLGTDGGAHLERIELVCEAEVPGLDADAFRGYAEQAKESCPVSKALAATPISLEATLLD